MLVVLFTAALLALSSAQGPDEEFVLANPNTREIEPPSELSQTSPVNRQTRDLPSKTFQQSRFPPQQSKWSVQLPQRPPLWQRPPPQNFQRPNRNPVVRQTLQRRQQQAQVESQEPQLEQLQQQQPQEQQLQQQQPQQNNRK